MDFVSLEKEFSSVERMGQGMYWSKRGIIDDDYLLVY